MNRSDFIRLLRTALKRLPPNEIENAVGFYEEYFDDAGPENEKEILEELGSPAAVASKIIGEYAVNELNQKRIPRRTHPLPLVLLGILASPVALPLAFALVVTMVALIFALIVVFFSLGFAAAAVAVQGILIFFIGFAIMGQSFGSGLFFVGYGVFSVAVGTALVAGILRLSRITFAMLQKVLARYLIKKGERQK